MDDLTYKVNAADADNVLHLKLSGSTEDEIADILGISKKLLHHHYADILGKGYALHKAKLSKKLFEAADKGIPQVLVYLGKTILGWSEDTNPTVVIPQIVIGAVDDEVNAGNLEQVREEAVADGRLIVGKAIGGDAPEPAPPAAFGLPIATETAKLE